MLALLEGKTERPSFIGNGHEMAHASDFYQAYNNDLLKPEWCALYREI